MRRALLVLLFCTSSAMAQAPPIDFPAGAYTVTTAGPTTITWTATSVTISWAAPAPAPTPAPIPPAPSPVPVLTGHVWILAVYDPAVTLPAAQQAALDSATLKASSLLQDVDFQPHAKTDAAVASWLPHLPAALPALLVVQSEAGHGKLVYSVAMPASEAEISALVNKVRGK